MNPDFRVPETVKVDNGLHEGEEEEIGDATEENRRIEEQRDASGQREEGRAGNSNVPTKKTGAELHDQPMVTVVVLNQFVAQCRNEESELDP
ncbi:hypothetical protein NDU88_004970 [Pleurodeles waltl]|uniref:Uncharacterized protein n=1 Tax=Pleurodeles waltl TaxID=8319 RepID=A0AAV7RMR7_PLEWA|nr:hypothetical protein NDU88_004970 [Pleurodeles waltl]